MTNAEIETTSSADPAPDATDALGGVVIHFRASECNIDVSPTGSGWEPMDRGRVVLSPVMIAITRDPVGRSWLLHPGQKR